MRTEPAAQANFERDHTWERSWPKCFLAVIGVIQILLSLLILTTEILSIITDFWYTNVFGGIWAFVVLFANWIVVFVTVCCSTTVRTATCSFVWNFITILALSALIVFDVIFILNPRTCILTPTCSSQTPLTQINFITSINQYQYYSIYDAKQLYHEIQVGCAGVAFILSLLYVIIFLICRLKLRQRTLVDNPAAAIVPQARGLRTAHALVIPVINPDAIRQYSAYQ